MWDKQTCADLSILGDAGLRLRRLASFSVPQLDAFSVILQGECPLLSRAVRPPPEQSFGSVP